jgi:hypothetical protein
MIETAGQPCDPNYVDPNASGGFDVTPTGADPADVDNVQCALDNTAAGGTVLLKDDVPFDYGGSAVTITTPNVILRGETDGIATDQFPAGTPTTKIGSLGGAPGCTGILLEAPGTKVLSLELSQAAPPVGRYSVNVLAGQDGNAVEIKGNKLANGIFGIMNVCAGRFPIASPVEIENNDISGIAFWGIIIANSSASEGINVDNNSIEAGSRGIGVWDILGDVNINHNSIATSIGMELAFLSGDVKIEDNDISATWGGIYVNDYYGTLDIKGNDLSQIGVDGISIGSWRPGAKTGGVSGDPEDGENQRTEVSGNSIGLVNNGMGALGMLIGSSASGVNHAEIKNNKLTGKSDYVGILKGPYGHNNRITDNDLSELIVCGAQILQAGGRRNRFSKNKLGPVAGPWGWGPGGEVNAYTPAVLSATVNWHEFHSQNTPDPVNEGNIFSNNDYTGTVARVDCAGDATEDSFLDEEDPKLIILDFMQKFEADWTPYQWYYPDQFDGATNIVSGNNKWPGETKVCTQVMDLTNEDPDNPDLVEGTSHVAGWIACEAHARKDAFEAAGEAYKNFGQFLKARKRPEIGAM